MPVGYRGKCFFSRVTEKGNLSWFFLYSDCFIEATGPNGFSLQWTKLAACFFTVTIFMLWGKCCSKIFSLRWLFLYGDFLYADFYCTLIAKAWEAPKGLHHLVQKRVQKGVPVLGVSGAEEGRRRASDAVVPCSSFCSSCFSSFPFSPSFTL